MDVLVVGAGPVGLTMAAQLARMGVSVRIIEKVTAPSPFSKALAVHARTLEGFEQMGIACKFLERGHRVNKLQAWRGKVEPFLDISFDRLDSEYPFIIDIPQRVTEEILTAHLAKCGVTVEHGIELIGVEQEVNGVSVRLKHMNGHEEVTRAPWLVGCDGAHSTVRHQLGIPFCGTEYPDTFIMGDVRVEWALPEDNMHLHLSSGKMLLAFPYGNGRYRLMADLGTIPEEPVNEVTIEELQAIVDARSDVPAKVSDPVWMTRFHSHMRHVAHMRQRRIFLAGDAAHVHSPAGGQGMNTGIQDAYNLAWKLALVCTEKAPDSLLDTYEVERMGVIEDVLKLSDRLLQAITTNRPLVKLIRDHFAPLVLHYGAAQSFVSGQISEIAIHYRESPLTVSRRRAHVHRHGLKAGDRAPNITISDTYKDSVRLLDDLRDNKPLLLTFYLSSNEIRSLMEGLRPYLGDVVIRRVVKDVLPKAETDSGYILDLAGDIAHRYGLTNGGIVVIRPDGYVGYMADRCNVSDVISYFWRIFIN